MRRVLVIILLISFSTTLCAQTQQPVTDSLRQFLATAKEPADRVQALITLGYELRFNNVAEALNVIAQAEREARKARLEDAVARVILTRGKIQQHAGKADKAMKDFLDALRIFETIQDKQGQIQALNSIGLVYDMQGNSELALINYRKSLDLALELKSKPAEAIGLLNLGVAYMTQQKIPEARLVLDSAYRISVRLNDRRTMMDCLNNIGWVHSTLGHYDSAFANYNEVIRLSRLAGDSASVAAALNNSAVIWFNTGKLSKSAQALEHAVNAASAVRALAKLQLYYENLAELYDTLRDYRKALTFHRLAVQTRDSLQGTETGRKIAELQYQYETDKRNKELELAAQQKALQEEAEDSRQKLIMVSLIGGVLIAILALGWLLTRMRLLRRQKQSVEKQNKIVEGINKEITDSIAYANRIQTALLASDELLSSQLPEHFVFYRPKAIVSGDFYWGTVVENRFYFCVADCTGHGVPGAFMSLLNINYLNEALTEKKISSPDKILDHVRQRIIHSLNSSGQSVEARDGMDAVLCVFDLKGGWLRFAAANNPVWVVRNGELKEFPGDKMPVGMHHGEQKGFSLQTLGLRRGDMIYLFSDGFADQFGGPQGKKYKYRKLKDLFLNIASLPVAEQSARLQKELDGWKGELEQVDDILITGIRI